MRLNTGITCILLALSACAAPPNVSLASPSDAPALAREVERLARGRVLWPGFDPLAVPLAVFDGERTFLFRHPSPPGEFVSVPDGTAHVRNGRHPEIVANSTTKIGGVRTGTILLSRETEGTLIDLAAVAVHEAFHVFQHERHADWSGADESVLFLYPIDDPQLLALRRLETEALRRALRSSDMPDLRRWSRAALSLRGERYARLDESFVAYERGIELIEGTAMYVERRAAGDTVEVPERGFAVVAVRARGYVTGAALATILDRLQPGWTASFAEAKRPCLDAVLASALGDTAGAAFSAAEIVLAERRARTDVVAVEVGRKRRRLAFDARPGWRVLVRAAAGQPLWPQGFDPINLERIDGGVLHTRFLKLGNASGRLEAMDGQGTDLEVLTKRAGRHPLLNGVREVVIAGLPEPRVDMDDRGVRVVAPGFEAEFMNARVDRKQKQLVVQLMRSEQGKK